MPPRSGLERSDFVLWSSTSVRCVATNLPESEVDWTCLGHGENGTHDPLWTRCSPVFDEREIMECTLQMSGFHSPLMPAALMMGHHCSTSALCNAANAPDVC